MDPWQMPVPSLAAACREETAKFRRQQPYREEFCFELFRRAVCARDEAAWEALLAQYRLMVLSWVRQHPASVTLGGEDDYWLNRTFERFWRAIGPDRFSLFPNLPSLLKYLKACVHSVLLDEVRLRQSAHEVPFPEAPPAGDDDFDVEAAACAVQMGRDLWRAIDRELGAEVERALFYLSFSLGMKPREICERYPSRFPSVAEVYRIKRNVLERLRRNPEVLSLLT